MSIINCSKCGGLLQASTAGYYCPQCHAQFDAKGEELYLQLQGQDISLQQDPMQALTKVLELGDALSRQKPTDKKTFWKYCPHCGHKLE